MSFYSNVKRVALLLIILISAYFSFSVNLFGVASDRWFSVHQIDSEQLVLDGLLYSDSGEALPVLGRYTRPQTPNQYELSRKLYLDGNKTGDFKQYKSQFGLQVKLFSVLNLDDSRKVEILHSITAFLMSLVVAGMFWFVWRDFSLLPATVFAGVFIFSPWVVVFARNLYWVSFTWFLPLFITMWLSSGLYDSRKRIYLMSALLFLAYLIKLLCGYEYVTTIFIATCVPIVYFGLKSNYELKRIIHVIIFNFGALLLSFSLALYIHATSIKENGASSGFAHIYLTAKKRISSANPEELAKQVCDGDSECETVMIASLVSNPVDVVKRYFFVPDFFPWLSRYNHNFEERTVLKNSILSGKYSNFHDAYNSIGFIGVINVFISVIISSLSKFGFIIFAAVSFLAIKNSTRSIQVAATISLLAPLSWFLSAKGHSYIHYHMNYVLWYLPFVPILSATLGMKLVPRGEHNK